MDERFLDIAGIMARQQRTDAAIARACRELARPEMTEAMIRASYTVEQVRARLAGESAAVAQLPEPSFDTLAARAWATRSLH